jgi:mannose-1-phosphate guanylyltransferase
MNAIILAAGLGRRLRPITDEIPKPLLPIIDRPVIDIIIDRLMAAGANRIGINLFHRHEQIADHLATKKDLEIVVEKILTDTGGPLVHFLRLFNRDVILHNCDILTDFDLDAALDHHRRRRPLATLLLVRHKGTNLVQTCMGRIVKFHRRDKPGFLTYTGIAVLNRGICEFFPKGKKVFSIKEALAAAINAGQPVDGLRISGAWYDIGGLLAYWRIHHDLLKGKTELPGLTRVADGKYIAPSSRVDTEHISGFCSVGAGCQIGRNVRLKDSIVLPGTRMEYGRYRSAIISNQYCVSV